MTLRNKFTGIALALCVGVTSVAIPSTSVKAAKDTNTTTAASVQKEVNATVNYLKQKQNDTEISVFDYRKLILMLQSDVDCTSEFDDYMNAIAAYTTEDGKIAIGEVENVTLYAAVIDILTIAGKNPADYNGINYLNSFATYLSTFKTAEELNDAIGNPYYYSYIIPALYSYKDEIANASTYLDLLKDAVMLNYKSDENEIGIDYYGVSTDNNGKVLSVLSTFAETDANFKAKMDDAIAWTIKTNRNEDGGFISTSAWGDLVSNSDSTGLAIELLSAYDYDDYAEAAYKSLLTMKSSKTEGCYSFHAGEDDNDYATVDALEGLVAYSRYLEGVSACPFDVTPYKVFTVKFLANGGKIEKASSATFNVLNGMTLKNIKIADPVRKGYTFAGWYTKKTAGDKLTSKYVFKNEATFYARWNKVTVKKPSSVKLKASKNSVTVSIKAVNGAKSYTIVYADNNKFNKAKKVTVSKTSTIIKNLKKNKKYFVKVCANKLDSTNKTVSSSFSSVKNITVK